jgi:RNA polymerase sigma-70 factor (sigma-E family)
VRHVVVRGDSADVMAERVQFETLFNAQRAGLVRLAYVITGSSGVAEEVVQEAFVRLHQRWSDIDNPIGFLRTVVTNLSRSEVRRFKLQQRERMRPVEPTGDPEIDETWAAVCRLPFRQRAVLALRYYVDLPETEIARVLGCRIGTVKSCHHRAIAKLRKELS